MDSFDATVEELDAKKNLPDQNEARIDPVFGEIASVFYAQNVRK